MSTDLQHAVERVVADTRAAYPELPQDMSTGAVLAEIRATLDHHEVDFLASHYVLDSELAEAYHVVLNADDLDAVAR